LLAQSIWQCEVFIMVEKGLVFSIERYAVHDGPGIRTLVYLKGCPLRCLWCSNPEGQYPNPELVYFEERCIGCCECIIHCPNQAIDYIGGKLVTNKTKCSACGECAKVCPTEARYVYGKYMTVEEIVEICKKDLSFYRRTGGGVTLSGGEPTYQYDFAIGILKVCKEEHINTAIETSGFSPWNRFRDILIYTDYVLYDIKHMDPLEHKKLTGVTNKIILDNLKKTSKMGKSIFVRVPIIPGLNDSQENLDAMVNFLKSLDNIVIVNLLPYHEYGKGKYDRLNRIYPLDHKHPPHREDMERAKKIIEKSGFDVKIGG